MGFAAREATGDGGGNPRRHRGRNEQPRNSRPTRCSGLRWHSRQQGRQTAVWHSSMASTSRPLARSASPEVAGALAKAGEYSKSRELAEQIADQDMKSSVLLAIARGLAAAGKVGEAAEAASNMADQRRRDRALAASAAAAAADEQADLALALADKITDPKIRDSAVVDAVDTLVRAGLTLDESRLLEHVSASKQQEMRVGIAHGLAASGNLQDALRLARSISGPWRTVALARIADTIEDPGQSGKRAEILRNMADSLQQTAQPAEGTGFADALSAGIAARAAAARSFAKAGQADQATDLAGTIAHPGTRRNTLRDIAVSLAEIGNTEKAEVLATAPTSRRGGRP